MWQAPPERAPLGERIRRGVLVAVLWLTAGALVAAFPYLATAALALTVWLLRSGSLAASAAGARRQLRGMRWYDSPQLLLSAPWHLVQSIPSTVMLLLWAGGLGLAGALIGYAAALPAAGTLFVAGTMFASALWLGPGGSRVRGPVNRLVHPLSARPVQWFVATLVVAALGTGAGAVATETGVNWEPARDAPLRVG